jgi:ABC-type nitrate/sulfonate/bicarbonate transport system substrate-binding protein
VPEHGNLQFLSFWVAIGAGLFVDEGLDVELVFSPTPDQAPQLLLQQQADVAVLMPPMFLGMIADAHPVKLFANLLTHDPINLIVDRDLAQALDLSASAPLAERLEALTDRRIGVAPQAAHRLRVLFASVGMNADQDIEIVVTHGEEQIQALADGTVDALYTHTPYLEEALVEHDAFLLVHQSAGEVPELAGLQIHSLVTTQSYMREAPQVLFAVTRAIQRAQQLVHSDPSDAVRAVLRSGVPGLVTTRVEAVVDVYRPATPRTPVVLADGIIRAAPLFPSRPRVPDFTAIDVEDYIASQFARKAVCSTRPPRAARPAVRDCAESATCQVGR